MSTHEELKAKAAATYNAAADCFDSPDNTFWERFGRATVDRLGLTPGVQGTRRVCRQRGIGDSCG